MNIQFGTYLKIPQHVFDKDLYLLVIRKVGGNTYQNIRDVTVKNTYINEIFNPVANTTYSAKIGLMYVSDYGYAAGPNAWAIALSVYNNSTATSNNWMYMGLYDWTITRRSDTTNFAYFVDLTGYVLGSAVDGYSGV